LLGIAFFYLFARRLEPSDENRPIVIGKSSSLEPVDELFEEIFHFCIRLFSFWNAVSDLFPKRLHGLDLIFIFSGKSSIGIFDHFIDHTLALGKDGSSKRSRIIFNGLIDIFVFFQTFVDKLFKQHFIFRRGLWISVHFHQSLSVFRLTRQFKEFIHQSRILIQPVLEFPDESFHRKSGF